jgi:tetratricopeptide (TPR) repeat protein
MKIYDQAIMSYRHAYQLGHNEARFTIRELERDQLTNRLEGEGYKRRGDAYYESGDYAAAISCYERAISFDPSDASTHYRLGSACYALRDDAHAFVSYRQALRLGHKEARSRMLEINKGEEFQRIRSEVFRREGDVLYKLGFYDSAINSYRKSLNANPVREYEIQNKLGLSYTYLGEYESALACYARAIRLKADYAYAYYNMGSAYCRLKEYAKSLDCYGSALRLGYMESGNRINEITALQLSESKSETHRDRGDLYYRKGDYESAIGCYTRAIELDRSSVVSHVGMGNCRVELGDYAGACKCYARALALDGSNADAYLNMGYACVGFRCYDRAITYFQKAIDNTTEGTGVYHIYSSMGAAHLELKRYDRAIVCYERAIATYPGDAESYHALGTVYLLLHRYKEFLGCMRCASSLGHLESQEYLQLLGMSWCD